MGAENVIVSMAGEGAILITSDRIFKSTAPKGLVKNSVGAGDSMVAGLLAGYLMNNNLMEAFKMGVAAGSATAFSEGFATKEKVEKLLLQLSNLQEERYENS
jgi:1-phosphofructokinase